MFHVETKGYSMDSSLERQLIDGAQQLGIPLEPKATGLLLAFQEEMLKWNEKVNLTALSNPEEALEMHLLDSLAIWQEVSQVGEALGVNEPKMIGMLDLGAGAGFPGIPLAVLFPHLHVMLIDTVDKKVAFMKSGAVKAGVAERVRVMHAHLMGYPDKEGLPRASVVIARAFMGLEHFLKLAVEYMLPGGRIIAMLGNRATEQALKPMAVRARLRLSHYREYELPVSKAERRVAVFRDDRNEFLC